MAERGQRKDKIWREALHKAVKAKEAGKPKALERLANALVKKALDGDVAAIKEIGDRLDGKPAQDISAKVEGNIVVEVVRFSGAK